MYPLSRRLLVVVSLSACSSLAYAQERSQLDSLTDGQDSVHRMEQVVVHARQMLGSKFEARNRTGSAYYLSPKELAKFGYTDISRMLRAVPGVNIYEEDGFGLRPNISLRGTKAERSERISLMEDGILAAPAPYAAPAAYYFPNAARMHAIEVLKGSSQVQYGPFTTGGAVNLVSTPIPTRFKAGLRASYGSYGTFNSYAHIGSDSRHFGYLVEYLRYQSKGFRRDIPDERTGFYRNDIVGKLRLHTAPETSIQQALELKLGFANERSDESYVGLSATDFARQPYLRYRGAQMDEMRTRHWQSALTYLLDFSHGLRLTTSAYYNYFWRNWYKLNDVRIGYRTGEKRTIEQILADPEASADYFAILTGVKDADGEALLLHANQRSYHSRGIQTKLEYRLPLLSGMLDLEAGARYHADLEDRFQHEDSYAMHGGRMELYRAGLPGNQSNRITTAHAFASYLLGKWSNGRWTLTAGLRLEDVDLIKRDYTVKDPRRTGHLRIDGSNHATALLPSFGVNYKLLRPLSIFAGVHQGFAPPSVLTYYRQKAEKSINLEAGLRLSTPTLKVEAIAYHNAYSNMLGSDLAAAGGQGTLDQFAVGAARVQGFEFLASWLPIPQAWKWQLPLQVSYTFTDTEMKNEFYSSAWEQVYPGDELPYIYRHALNAQLGIEYRGWEANLTMRYNGAMRTQPGQGQLAELHQIPAHTILDASIKVQVNKHLTLTANAVNLMNKAYLTSRHPAGLRAGHPFGIYGGFRLSL